MAYDTVLYEVDDHIATLTLNRPDRLNAWNATMGEEVRDALYRAGKDKAVRAIILTGAGRGFCAGADMNLLSSIQKSKSDKRPKAKAAKAFDAKARPDFQKTYSYFPSIPKPIIGAINGPCAGLGLVIALYCDIRFAADAAVFTTAFAARGLIAEHGISWTLPRLIGPSNAMDLLLSARKVDAQEALRLGLVSRVYPLPQLLDETRAYARTLATTVSPRSVGVMKRQLWEAQFQTLAKAIDLGDTEMKKSFKSEDFKEGVAHYVEKRAPRFTGR